MTTDHYSAAVSSWYAGESDKKEFAIHCVHVKGPQTAALASDCGLSVDAIEGYRNCARLLHEMNREIETPDVNRVWHAANLSLWVAAAKVRKHYKLDVLFDLLSQAADNKTKVETFRTLIDPSTQAEWVRGLTRLFKGFDRWVMDYKGTDMPYEVRARLERLAEYNSAELQAIVLMEVEA